MVETRGRKLGVDVLQSVGDKGAAIRRYCVERKIEPASVVFVGNDINDLPALNVVGYPLAVADAHERVKAAAWFVLTTRGGQGVAREVVGRVIDLENNPNA